MDTTAEITEIGARWAQAEQDGDTEALDALAADGFVLVGPVGFVLDRQQWLGRFRGGLTVESLGWDEVEVHDHGAAAVAIGRQTQRASFGGNRADGQFRTTHVFVRDAAGAWKLASLHVGMLGGPPPFLSGGPAT
jgi:ketosteroid isomerase-like protein